MEKRSSTMQEIAKKIFNSNNRYFYDEQFLILDKYAHLETPYTITKSLKFTQISKNTKQMTKNTIAGNLINEFMLNSISFANKNGKIANEVPLMTYWPTFASLNSAQKKWYFYWRAQALKEKFLNVDFSYISLFAYELINYTFNRNAAFNVSMLIKLYEGYRERIDKIENYFPKWIADMLFELNETKLAQEWLPVSSDKSKIYLVLEEKLDLKDISITTWKPYFKAYKETGFYVVQKNKVNKQFKEDISALQKYYEFKNIDIKEVWFEKSSKVDNRKLFGNVIISRPTIPIYIRDNSVIPSQKMTQIISNLLMFSENQVRKSLGENQTLTVDEKLIPIEFQNRIQSMSSRFKEVEKPSAMSTKHKIPEKPTVKPRNIVKEEVVIREIQERESISVGIQFDWDKINRNSEKLTELTNQFEVISKDEKMENGLNKNEIGLNFRGLKITKHKDNSNMSNSEVELSEVKSENKMVTLSTEVEMQFDWDKINQNSAELTILTERFEDTQNYNLITKEQLAEANHTVLKFREQNIMFKKAESEPINSAISFIRKITEVEQQFLKLTENNTITLNQATNFAKSKGLMLQMFISDINEKAEELLGKSLIEEDDDILLVAEEFPSIKN